MTVAIRTNEMLFTSKDAAQFLGLDPNTIATYVKRKLLVPISRVGTSYLFTKPEVERFKETRRSPGNPTFQKKSAAKPKPKAKRYRKTGKSVA